jgi:hypothetical protein
MGDPFWATAQYNGELPAGNFYGLPAMAATLRAVTMRR